MTERLEKSAWRGPIFQSHGTGDPVLPVSMARALTALIRESERQVTSIEFNGGHEIPPVVMQQLNEFLKKNNQSER
jgi:phospholipase/carboxylesterase